MTEASLGPLYRFVIGHISAASWVEQGTRCPPRAGTGRPLHCPAPLHLHKKMRAVLKGNESKFSEPRQQHRERSTQRTRPSVAPHPQFKVKLPFPGITAINNAGRPAINSSINPSQAFALIAQLTENNFVKNQFFKGNPSFCF